MDDPANGDLFLDDILERARRRAEARGAPHAGDLTPFETAALLDERAITLVDVRTRAEWALTGRVPGARRVEWSTDSAGTAGTGFVEALSRLGSGGRPVVLLCRSGMRSERAALAAAQAGLDSVFNMLEGFEGDPDEHGNRSSVNGWRHAGLPWIHDGELVP